MREYNYERGNGSFVVTGECLALSRPDFISAERLARRRARAGDAAAHILGPDGSLLAEIRFDSLGRLWTDLTTDGAKLI